MKKWEIEWSRKTFDMMSMNAIWAVPRTGLIFHKVNQYELALIALQSPEHEGFDFGLKELPKTEMELQMVRRVDFNEISKRFKAAGIRMTDPKGLLKD